MLYHRGLYYLPFVIDQLVPKRVQACSSAAGHRNASCSSADGDVHWEIEDDDYDDDRSCDLEDFDDYEGCYDLMQLDWEPNPDE